MWWDWEGGGVFVSATFFASEDLYGLFEVLFVVAVDVKCAAVSITT